MVLRAMGESGHNDREKHGHNEIFGIAPVTPWSVRPSQAVIQVVGMYNMVVHINVSRDTHI